MRRLNRLSLAASCLALALAAGTPAGATTLVRQSLDALVAAHPTIVVGQVVAAHSYWNADDTFIVTDFEVRTTDVLKGEAKGGEIDVTVLGGTVGDITVLIPGGADYVPGKTYVLFLGAPLPGTSGDAGAPAHAQGVFEVVRARDGMRAISQANSHPLHPDALGFVDPPGGAEGLPLEALVRSIRELAQRHQANLQNDEVKK